MPNHRMTSGISARCGMFRTICNVLSVSFSLSPDRPFSMPRAKPMPPPMANPAKARQVLTSISRNSSPLRVTRQNASATAVGAGMT